MNDLYSKQRSQTQTQTTTNTTHPSIRYSTLLKGSDITALKPETIITQALAEIKQQQTSTSAETSTETSISPSTETSIPTSTSVTPSAEDTSYLLTKMSVHELLSLHLDDYVVLIDGFLESLSDPDYITRGLPQHIITKILRKDQLMQQAVNKLVGHQHFERVLASLRSRITELDTSIISFARILGEHEQTLHQQVTDSKTLTNIQGEITKQRFSVPGVFHFSERLSTMSFAPPNFIEHIGLAANKPPAPLEKLMASSKLLMGVDELVTWAENERKRERGELVEPTANTDITLNTTTSTTSTVATLPPSTSTLPSSLPTFADLDTLAPLAPLSQSTASSAAAAAASAAASRARRPAAALPIDLNDDLSFLDDMDTGPTTTNADSDHDTDDEL